VNLLTRRAVLLCALFIATSVPAYVQNQPSGEQKTARYFESVRNQPLLLAAFLQQMPKGGDLHNHLSGAVYAESYIEWAASDGLCIDRKALAFVPPPCDSDTKPPATVALKNSEIYYKLIDAFSMRGLGKNGESGHDHFFASFAKFGAATRGREGDMLAEVVSRAGNDYELYLELMNSQGDPAAIGKAIGWDDNLDAMREKMLAKGMKELVASVRKSTDESERRMRELMKCSSPDAQPGCGVQVCYITQGIRNAPREQVFAQLVAGMELAQSDPRFVGVTLVSPEDGYVSMHDFDSHMRMLAYLRQKYPTVRVSLHAGELAPQLVPPEGLSDHIRKSVEVARADRIGHGVDVMYERQPIQLLQEMAKRKVLVEICLTSNDGILNIRGAQHPLPLYIRYGVPVALATDDEGVSRGNLSHEYQRATETYGLKYAELKKMARTSLEYSFLPGNSLWSNAQNGALVPACAGDKRGAEEPSRSCAAYLDQSERAQMQWKLEREFAAFESRF
jgi:adenosine deaminase